MNSSVFRRLTDWNLLLARVFYDETGPNSETLDEDDVAEFQRKICGGDTKLLHRFYVEMLFYIYMEMPKEDTRYFRNEITMFLEWVPYECFVEYNNILRDFQYQ